jgi:hypothetical protein
LHDRLLELPFAVERDTQVVVRLRVVGLEANRLGEMGDRLLRLAALVQ